jgi:hypothetical protein
MNRKKLFSMAAAATFLMLTFWVGTVYAATGCFNDTNGHKFEQAICWMKENKIAIGNLFKPDDFTTRGQAAIWLQKQSQIPPTQGLILISEGFGNWHPFFSTDNITFENYSNVSYVKKATTGSNFISLQPSIPTVFYGRSLQLLGVEFCYTASTSVVFSYVEINTFTHTNSAGSRTMQFSDSTDHTDSACLYYVLPTPVTLTAEDGANIFVQATWNTANSPLILGRTTFVFRPTGTKAAAPSGMKEVLLQEGGLQTEGGTSAP